MKAVILAAGLGTRLGNLTKDCPKPLLPIQGRPLVEYLIFGLKAAGVTEIGLNLWYLSSKFQEVLGTGENLGVKLTYVTEEKPTGTAGGVRSLQDFWKGSENILVLYGDVLTNFPFKELMDFHLDRQAKLSFVVHRRSKSNSLVEMNSEGLVTKFLERPAPELLEGIQETWVNSGLYCVHHSLLEKIPSQGEIDFPRDIFPLALQEKTLYALPLGPRYRLALDSPDRYDRAQAEVAQHFKGIVNV